MSTCISWYGEFSEHVPDDLHTCIRCQVLDEEALCAELVKLRELVHEGASVAREQAAWADRFRAELQELRDGVQEVYDAMAHPYTGVPMRPDAVAVRLHGLLSKLIHITAQ